MLITIASCFAIVTLVVIVRYGVPSDHSVTKKPGTSDRCPVLLSNVKSADLTKPEHLKSSDRIPYG